MAVSIKITVSWNVTQCSLVDTYQCFRRIYCFHRQGRKVKTVTTGCYEMLVLVHTLQDRSSPVT
jgi:hypothetical protein